MAEHLTIGEIAERTGLSVHTLRFYEREGVLVRPVARDAGGRRLYTEGDVDWLETCVLLRASGMPLPDIRRYAELIRQGAGTTRERLELMRAHRDRVLVRIEELNRALDLITFKVGVYEDRLESRPEGECRISVS
ncbi:MAG TPA: MerR family transcriptional regulator [Nonomuraea sp.]|nr:MerR family transcriptional regulator [Nonomuraea sp.]